MINPERFETGKPHQSPDLSAVEHPQLDEGVFDSTPQFDTYVERIKFKSEEPKDQFDNILTRYRVVMSDGTKLGLNVCRPKEEATDIPVVQTPAWFTGLHGHNEHSQRELGRVGIPSILLGHVGSERDSVQKEIKRAIFQPFTALREMRRISLARQAHNMLAVHKESGQWMFDTENAFLFGESRGAMTLIGACALSSEHNTKIPFAFAVAPCFETGLTRENAAETSQQLLREGVNIARLVGRISVERLRHYPNTFNPSPKSLIYELVHIPALLSGEAGQFVPRIPVDQALLNLSFENDMAGQHARWEEAFAEHPNVYVRKVPGAHGSIVDRRTLAYAIRAFDNFGKQLESGVSPSELNLAHVQRPVSAVN